MTLPKILLHHMAEDAYKLMVSILTKLQFCIVDAILGAAPEHKINGRVLREKLREVGINHSGPAFYQTMSRLEERGLISGDYVFSEVGGQMVRERQYRLLDDGKAALDRTRKFYQDSNAAKTVDSVFEGKLSAT